jgi:uncharacterized membrane protein
MVELFNWLITLNGNTIFMCVFFFSTFIMHLFIYCKKIKEDKQYGVNAQYNGSIVVKITFPINPYF